MFYDFVFVVEIKRPSKVRKVLLFQNPIAAGANNSLIVW